MYYVKLQIQLSKGQINLIVKDFCSVRLQWYNNVHCWWRPFHFPDAHIVRPGWKTNTDTGFCVLTFAFIIIVKENNH